MHFNKIAITLLSLLLLGGCDYFQSTQAYVECNVALGGVSCSVERRQGNQAVSACWDVSFVCVNGITTSARSCHPVQPGIGSKSVKTIYWSEFNDFSSCDKVASSSVGNIIVKRN